MVGLSPNPMCITSRHIDNYVMHRSGCSGMKKQAEGIANRKAGRKSMSAV